MENFTSTTHFSTNGNLSERMKVLALTFRFSKGNARLKLTSENEYYTFEKSTRPDAFNDNRALLPTMSAKVELVKGQVVPSVKYLQQTKNQHWDYIFGIGRYWFSKKHSSQVRIDLPFSLVEKNQNCVHNGVISTLIDKDTQHTTSFYQISSETCIYFQADMWGIGTVDLSEIDSLEIPPRNEKIIGFSIKPITDNSLSISTESLLNNMPTEKVSLLGMHIDDEIFQSQCPTRAGNYPFCSQLVLPSYSTAKSIFAGMSFQILTKQYPELPQHRVSDWIAECPADKWQDVTFNDLLNMTTGNYLSKSDGVDEAAEHSQRFFTAFTHQDKLAYSCHHFSKQEPAGQTFVYHSSDTYLLGTALDNFLSAKSATKKDVYDDLWLPIIANNLNLSEVARKGRRTNDQEAQFVSGYGLFFLPADIAKIVRYMSSGYEDKSTQSNATFSAHISSPASAQMISRSTATDYKAIRYLDSFWLANAQEALNCEDELWLPFMSGYGGIAIVFLPENKQYYFYSDSGKHGWFSAIKSIHQKTPLCKMRVLDIKREKL